MTFVTCCVKTCGITFPMADAFYSTIRRDGRTFYCPNGHDQFFDPTPDKRDRLLKDMEREIYQHRRNRDRFLGKVDYLTETLMLYAPPGLVVVDELSRLTIWKCPCGRSGQAKGSESYIRGLLRKHIENGCGVDPSLADSLPLVPSEEGSS